MQTRDLDTSSVGLAVGSSHAPIVWVQRKNMKLSGGQAYLAMVFGGLFGVAGAILGVPIFAALQLVVREVTSGRRSDIARIETPTDASDGRVGVGAA